MPRTLKGSITQRGDVFDASVPRFKGKKTRVTCTFPTHAAAAAWKAEQIARLNRGLAAEAAPSEGRLRRAARSRRPRVDAMGPDLLATAQQMVREDYDILRKGLPDRARDVLAITTKHLAPLFPAGIPTDAEAASARTIEWVVASAGRRLADEDLPSRHRLGLDPVPPPAKPFARSTMTERLRVLRRILDYAALRDARVVNFAKTIEAQEPSGSVEKVDKLLSLPETRLVAGQMHVVHQLTLWMVRLLGPRLSEPFGVLVGDFMDDDDVAVLLLQAQGGRPFALWGDELGEVVVTGHKKGGKTKAAYRLVGLPRQLASLIRVVIAAFHTDPITGEVDLAARLIPTIQAGEGGQAGFRCGLSRATERSGLVLNGDERLIPHGQRKALCTDFARDPAIDAFLARRWAGHWTSDDVHGRVYVRDLFRIEDLLPAIRSLERRIDEELGGSLIVPTTLRPLYGVGRPKEVAVHADAVLGAAGWQLDAFEGGWLGAAEAAALLGDMSVTATRRLFPGRIPAQKIDGEWRARVEDILAYKERLEHFVFLEDLIDETRRSYHQLYRLLGHLGLETQRDDYSRQLLLTKEQAQQMRAECRRIDALRARAVPVSVACRRLGVKHTAIPAMVRTGRLTYDPESDSTGWRFITLQSLEAAAASRYRAPSVVSTSALKAATGLDDAQLQVLCDQGVLVRARRGGFIRSSVRAWVVGYRPELLQSPLLAGSLA